MHRFSGQTELNPDVTERDLLRACRDGSQAAVARVVELHMNTGVSTARWLAPAHISNEEILDLVHNAFITAFDEALESGDDSIGPGYHRLIRTLVRGQRDGDEITQAHHRIGPHELRDLRDELIRELCVIVAIHAESPRARTPAQQLLAELRNIRRRLRFASAVVRNRWQPSS